MGKFLLIFLVFCVLTVLVDSAAKREKWNIIIDENKWMSEPYGLPINFFANQIAAPPFHYNKGEEVTFYCINRKTEELLPINDDDEDRPIEEKIDLKLPVVFLIHGWRRIEIGWVEKTAHDYIKYIDTNVCIVYWERIAWDINFLTVVSTGIPKVVEEVGNFIEELNTNHEISLDDITIVGHGLGGHIAGFVSNQFESAIGEIYALDPTGPLFTSIELEDKKYRLDKKDAKYIQTIVTTSDVFGSDVTMGHQCFKPNLGKSPQVACVYRHETVAKEHMKSICSHLMAAEYFRFSLNPENNFKAQRCGRNETNYLIRKCKGGVYDRMGVHAEKSKHGVFYLEPFGAEPYVKKDTLGEE